MRVHNKALGMVLAAVLIASMLSFGVDYAVMALAPSIAWLFVGRAIG
jgi:hypothetical protein